MDLSILTEDLLRKIMGFADDGAVLIHRVVSHQIRFSSNKIDIGKTWRETSISLMMDKDKKVNILNLSYPGVKNIDEVLEIARKTLDMSQPRPIYAELPEPPSSYPSIGDKVDKKILDRPDLLADMAKDSIDEALVSGARRVSGAVRGNYVEIYLATSKTNDVLTDSYTNIYLDVRAFVDGEDSGHASQLARNIDGLDPKRLGREAGEIAKLSTNTISIEPGRYDTVATPNAAAALMNLVGTSSSGFYVLMGRSFFRDKLGVDVAYKGLTISDNPHSQLSRAPRSFDDEGMPTKKNTIITEGRLTTYLHNRFTAKVFNSELTGNAGWIMPSAWHLDVSPGDMSREELVKELDKGFILNNVTYIRFQNHIKGDFSGVIRDGLFYVENGEIKGAVKGLRFSDNMPRILNNITGLGKDVENIFHWWIRLSVSTPSLLIRGCGYTKAYGL